MERQKPAQSPDILTKDTFAKGVHPYTARFLTAAYLSEAHRFLRDHLQRQLFNLYFMGELTIEAQSNDRGRSNLELEIIDGFSRLRSGVDQKLNAVLKPSMIPLFKEGDIKYLTNPKAEKKLRAVANRSISLKGKKRSEAVLVNIRKGHIKRNTPEFKRKSSETATKRWNDSGYKKWMLTEVLPKASAKSAENRRKKREESEREEDAV